MRLYLEVPDRLCRFRSKLVELIERYGLVLSDDLGDCDAMIIVGTDRDILTILSSHDETPPVITIAPPGYSGYLTSFSWEDVENVLNVIARGEFSVRSIARLRAVVDEQHELLALNEVAVFPHRSATLMEYTLRIDGEFVWRDLADGIIIATPLGSTAYALSAGGPIVLLNAPVFIVVPVNSTELSRRPLVVPQTSEIRIEDVASRTSVEVVCDGVKRVKVEENVVINVGREVHFVEIGRSVAALAKKKLRTLQELQSLPPSAKFVYRMLEIEGPMTVKDISSKTMLPERTVRYALNLLVEKGLVEKLVDPRDPRRHVYMVRSAFP